MKVQEIRHGDVQVQRLEAASVDGLAEVKAPTRGGHVLAEGEATGHAHRLHGGAARLYELPKQPGVRLLHVVRSVSLRHEEHGPVQLEPGFYRIGIKRQYDPEGGWSPVAD